MTVKVFDRHNYALRQVIDALTCPVNRHATRAEHNCDDWELWRHPNLLLDHYIENGGAAAFAKRREEFFKEVVVPDELEFYI